MPNPDQEYNDHLVVVAIDFGTTYSGYAFSMVSKQEKIFMNKHWSEISELKTPTSVLTTIDGEFKDFGYKAEQTFSDEAANSDSELCLFQHFKMHLHKLNKLNDKLLVKSKENKASLKAFELVTMSLRYIKDHAVEALSNAATRKMQPQDVKWVVTVPAIWSDASKRFMREAAFKAGLIDDVASKQLIIALEPESAALYVRSLDAKNFAVASTDATSMKKGTKYIVVDVGGGTVDIAVHQVTGPQHAVELFCPTGGHWGGTRVNEAFEKMMARILGEDTVKQLKKESPHAWWEFMSQFEMKKRKWEEKKRLNFQLSQRLSTNYREKKGEDIDEAFKRAKNVGISFRQGIILINDKCMKDIFDESVNQIISHLENLLSMEDLQGVEFMMVVGGYSESPYLQQAICDKFEGMLQILIPQDASLAVVKGAVMFGHNPDSIDCRRARKSYGVDIHAIFQPDMHDDAHRVVIRGREMARNVFSAFIRKDNEVPDDLTRQYSFRPLSNTDTEVTFVMCTADDADVMYTDEPSVAKVESLHLKVPADKTGDNNRPIGLEVTFGGTEIKIKVMDQSREDGVCEKADLFFDTT